MNVHDNLEFKRLAERGAALEAKAMAESPIYREPTLEDARELWNKTQIIHTGGTISETLSEACKQLGFYRKVQP